MTTANKMYSQNVMHRAPLSRRIKLIEFFVARKISYKSEFC